MQSGELEEGKDVVLVRDEESSPRFLEEHSSLDDLIQFRSFSSPTHQADWVVEEIRQNLERDELTPNDIIVINPDPISAPVNSWSSRSNSSTGLVLTIR